MGGVLEIIKNLISHLLKIDISDNLSINSVSSDFKKVEPDKLQKTKEADKTEEAMGIFMAFISIGSIGILLSAIFFLVCLIFFPTISPILLAIGCVALFFAPFALAVAYLVITHESETAKSEKSENAAAEEPVKETDLNFYKVDQQKTTQQLTKDKNRKHELISDILAFISTASIIMSGFLALIGISFLIAIPFFLFSGNVFAALGFGIAGAVLVGIFGIVLITNYLAITCSHVKSVRKNEEGPTVTNPSINNDTHKDKACNSENDDGKKDANNLPSSSLLLKLFSSLFQTQTKYNKEEEKKEIEMEEQKVVSSGKI